MNKKAYIIPSIEIIKLDNEISLALESVDSIYPAIGPDESYNNNSQPTFAKTPFPMA